MFDVQYRITQVVEKTNGASCPRMVEQLKANTVRAVQIYSGTRLRFQIYAAGCIRLRDQRAFRYTPESEKPE